MIRARLRSGMKALILSTVAVSSAAAITGCDKNKDQDSAEAAGGQQSQEAQMASGVDLLYTKNNPSAAVDTFRQVLKENPTHYGARFQLAKALDRSGRPDEARPIWDRVLAAANEIKDTASIRVAEARLAEPDTISQAAMMTKGVDLLYAKNDAAAAADQFRLVLQRNPTHYGATFQLAKALDQMGKSAEAKGYWQKMVSMADAIKDKPTADTARARLSR